jgi:hypothetical protein
VSAEEVGLRGFGGWWEGVSGGGKG